MVFTTSATPKGLKDHVRQLECMLNYFHGSEKHLTKSRTPLRKPVYHSESLKVRETIYRQLNIQIVIYIDRCRLLFFNPKFRVLHNIFLIPNPALFWKEISDVIPGNCWTTVAFTLHIFSSTSLSFSCSFFLMLLLLGKATSVPMAIFLCLSTTTISHWLAITSLFI